VSSIEISDKDYDPFSVLNVDREASMSEIKRAYRELGRKHHPDRRGDPEQFKEIAKAYRTLTNEEASENWRESGNPDGQRILRLGFAIPKWFVERENSMLVLMLYMGSFMIVLPVLIVCLLK
jgi:translocation protein SEC63